MREGHELGVREEPDFHAAASPSGMRSARERFMNGEWRVESQPTFAVPRGSFESLGCRERYVRGRSAFAGERETDFQKGDIFERDASEGRVYFPDIFIIVEYYASVMYGCHVFGKWKRE